MERGVGTLGYKECIEPPSFTVGCFLGWKEGCVSQLMRKDETQEEREHIQKKGGLRRQGLSKLKRKWILL